MSNLLQKLDELPERVNVSYHTVYAGAFSKVEFSSKNKEGKLEPYQYSWETCREIFADYFTAKLESFYFSHKPNQTENIQKFFVKVEKTLGLKNKDNHTVIKKTDKPNISLIIVPEWWRKYIVRRSLFTILLRSANNYNEKENGGEITDNFELALFSDKYAIETKPAVELFMKGNTFCKKNTFGYGWRDTFMYPANTSRLIKPPKKVVKVEDKKELKPISA